MCDEDRFADIWRVRAADGAAMDRTGLRARDVAVVELHARTEDLGAVGEFAGGCWRADDLARAAVNVRPRHRTD